MTKRTLVMVRLCIQRPVAVIMSDIDGRREIGLVHVTIDETIDSTMIKKSHRILFAHFLSLKYEIPERNMPIEFVRTAVYAPSR